MRFSTGRNKRPRRKTPNRFWQLTKITLLIVIPCVTWVAVNLPALREYMNARQQRDQMLRESDSLKKQIGMLRQEQEQLKDQAFGDEAVARERNYVKPGERVMFFEVDSGGASRPTERE